MTKTRVIMLALILSLVAPASAFACVAPPPLYDPSKIPADVIVEGVAGRVESKDDFSFTAATTVKIDKIWLGSAKLRSVRLSWVTLSSMCPPPQPPTSGARLMIYMREKNNALVPIGWLFVRHAPDRAAIEAANETARKWASESGKQIVPSPPIAASSTRS